MRRFGRHGRHVSVFGETGVGKELVALLLSEAGPYVGGPFVCVNCGAVPDSPFESELFGHARGSFTGAGETRSGAVDAARGGTLFLDEIGELPPGCQAKLLRLLDRGTFQRVGSSEERSAECQVVCATNRDLEAMVDAGTFRRDLYHRIAVLIIRVPPLRERPEDIPDLLASFAPLLPRPFCCCASAMTELASWGWLGNVRELRNFAERAVCASDTLVFDADELRSLAGSIATCPVPAATTDVSQAAASAVAAASLDAWLTGERGQLFTRLLVAAAERAVALEGGNQSAAARRLAVSRPKLLRTLALKKKLPTGT